MPLRSVPAKFIHGNIHNRLQEDEIKFPTKMHLGGRWARFGRPMGSAGPTSPPLATDLLWYTTLWVLFSDMSVPGLDTSVLF